MARVGLAALAGLILVFRTAALPAAVEWQAETRCAETGAVDEERCRSAEVKSLVETAFGLTDREGGLEALYRVGTPSWVREISSLWWETFKGLDSEEASSHETSVREAAMEEKWEEVAALHGYDDVEFGTVAELRNVSDARGEGNRMQITRDSSPEGGRRAAQIAAVISLAGACCPEAVGELTTLYGSAEEYSHDVELLRTLAIAIALLDSGEALDFLPRYLGHDEAAYRMSAVEGLSRVDNGAVTREILELVEDESWGVRLSVYTALYGRPFSEARDYLIDMLEGRDRLLAKAALDILAQQFERGGLGPRDLDDDLAETLENLVEREEKAYSKEAATLFSKLR